MFTRTFITLAGAAGAAGRIGVGEFALALETMPPALSRAQVRAELREAVRLGLVGGGEHSVVPSNEQLERIRIAGQQAVRTMTASN